MEKICFITPQFKTGGGNRVFIELANILSENNEIEIIYPNNSLDKNTFSLNNKVKITSIGRFKKFKLWKLFNMIYCLFWIRKNRKDYKLIITDPIMSLFYMILPLKNLYRFIQADDYRIFDDRAIIKNKWLLEIYKKMTLFSYRSKKIKFIFNSKYVYENFLRDRKNKDVSYKLVHPSINKEVFYNKKLRKDDELNICIVARKHPWKGFNDFTEGWKNFKFKEKINNIYIVSHDDLSEFDLSDSKYKVIVPKSDREISEIMNRSHIFISTSWWEGFGLPPLEALACGNSLLISRSGGVNEYAVEGKNCLMFEPKNQKELFEKLEVLINEESKRKELSMNRVETIKNFSWEKSAKQLFEILREKKNENFINNSSNI